MVHDSRNDITVTAVVVDDDTMRYGGSFFRREKACQMQRVKRDKYADEFECQTCYGHTWTPFGARPEFCCHCGARVERGA